jgi:hypothetical protein
MLTPSGVALMHNVESKVNAFATSRSERPRWQSLMSFFYPPTGRLGEDVPLLSQEEIEAALNAAFTGAGGMPGVAYPPPLGDGLFGYTGTKLTREAGGWASQFARSEVDLTADSSSDAVSSAWVSELNNVNPNPSSCEFTFAAPSLLDYIILQLVHQDLYKAVYALAFVGLCMLVHTGSIVMSLFGVVNSVLAFPLGYAVYREVLGCVYRSTHCRLQTATCGPRGIAIALCSTPILLSLAGAHETSATNNATRAILRTFRPRTIERFGRLFHRFTQGYHSPRALLFYRVHQTRTPWCLQSARLCYGQHHLTPFLTNARMYATPGTEICQCCLYVLFSWCWASQLTTFSSLSTIGGSRIAASPSKPGSATLSVLLPRRVCLQR